MSFQTYTRVAGEHRWRRRVKQGVPVLPWRGRTRGDWHWRFDDGILWVLEWSRVLDFGAGRGEMMVALSELGAEVLGVDPFAYRYLCDAGLSAFKSLDSLSPNIRVDGIVAIDVLEHLSHPWVQVRDLASVLKDSGWLFVATPNAGGLSARLSQYRWKEAMKASHLTFFTAQFLEATLYRSGFKPWRRLRWLINYRKGLPRSVIHLAPQIVGWDGEVRYLAWKC